jgi:hypothetical protein
MERCVEEMRQSGLPSLSDSSKITVGIVAILLTMYINSAILLIGQN